MNEYVNDMNPYFILIHSFPRGSPLWSFSGVADCSLQGGSSPRPTSNTRVPVALLLPGFRIWLHRWGK